jgi:hypothetical protein
LTDRVGREFFVFAVFVMVGTVRRPPLRGGADGVGERSIAFIDGHARRAAAPAPNAASWKRWRRGRVASSSTPAS